MRVSNMNRYNEKKDDYLGYYFFAVAFAFVCYIFVDILVKVLIIAFGVLLRYWWGALILLFVWLLLRKRGRKK